MDKDVNIQWEPIAISRETGEKLILQVLKGQIDRSQFTELWPPKERIIITWPEGD